MIKYIIFDLGEVLLTGIKITGLTLAEKHNLKIAGHPSPLKVPLREEFFHGNISEDEYIDEVLKTYPELGEREGLKRYIRDNFAEVAGTREIILRLKKLGYILALLSNHGKEWIEHLEKKYDFHQLFDAVSYSFSDKVAKPDKRAFEIILRKLNAKPDECLFVDDKIKNIQAAEALGIKSIQFENADKLDASLRNILPDYS